MKAFFRLVLLGLVLVIVALVSALTAMRFAIHGGEVSVPDLVGKAPAEAKRLVEGQGLEVNVERQYYSPTIPEGKIVSQSPIAGTHVRRGWQVRVAASLGPQRTEIPNVVGESERAAEINIRRRGLDVNEVAQVALPGAPAISSGITDQVISQSPPANASGVAAPKISLLINAAPQPEAFVMPSFLGQQLGSATSILQNAGMRLGSVTVAAPPANGLTPAPPPVQSPSSIIVSQNPAAGEKIITGATISFVVR